MVPRSVERLVEGGCKHTPHMRHFGHVPFIERLVEARCVLDVLGRRQGPGQEPYRQQDASGEAELEDVDIAPGGGDEY